jgi:hypothetical protein
MPGLKQAELFKSSPPARILLIELWPAWTECTICGEECLHRYGLAIYEDLVVPDHYEGEWGGAPACLACYELASEMQSERPGQFLTFTEIKARMGKSMKSKAEQMAIVYGTMPGQQCGNCAMAEMITAYNSNVTCTKGKFKVYKTNQACGIWKIKERRPQPINSTRPMETR